MLFGYKAKQVVDQLLTYPSRILKQEGRRKITVIIDEYMIVTLVYMDNESVILQAKKTITFEVLKIIKRVRKK